MAIVACAAETSSACDRLPTPGSDASLVIDAVDGITEHDAHVAGYILERGRAVVVAVNKWDAADSEQREKI